MNSKKKSPLEIRKEREKKERITTIKRVARELFYRKGYLTTTIDEIAYESGYSKPVVYQHFKSKDDLYCSLMIPMIDYVGQMLNEIKTKVAGSTYKTGRQLIKDLFKLYRDVYTLNPEDFRVLTLFQSTGMVKQLAKETREEIISMGKLNYGLTRQILELGIQQGLIRKVNVYHATDILTWGMFIGLLQNAELKSLSKEDMLGTMKTAEELMIRAIAKR